MASTARQRSGLRGVGKLRRTLRRLGPEATKDIRKPIERGADFILGDMLSLVPKDSGDLARALDRRIARDGLTARIGLVTPSKQRDLFYARFVEFGTKGGQVTARRAGGLPYTMNVPARPATPFMQPAFDLNRAQIVRETQTAIRLVLERVSRQGGAS